MDTYGSHRKLDWDLLPKRQNESLSKKIEGLVKAVDFVHAKNNFISAFLGIQDNIKSIKRQTKTKVFEIMHLDEILDNEVQDAYKKKVVSAKRQEVWDSIVYHFTQGIIKPVKEVCTLKMFKRTLAPVYSTTRLMVIFAIIFTATFAVTNIEALSTLGAHYVQNNTFVGDYIAQQEARQAFVTAESLAAPPEDLVLAESERATTQNSIILPLVLDVTPDDNRIVIPRIGKNIPIQNVADENVINGGDPQAVEDAIQEALQDGVVRYPGTSVPGKQGNVFLTGHSSYYLWAPGEYKDVFALLHEVEMDDEIIVYYNQKKYKYKVSEIKEVKPSEVDILGQTDDYRLTLMTCTPVGTTLRRLVITAHQVE